MKKWTIPVKAIVSSVENISWTGELKSSQVQSLKRKLRLLQQMQQARRQNFHITLITNRVYPVNPVTPHKTHRPKRRFRLDRAVNVYILTSMLIIITVLFISIYAIDIFVLFLFSLHTLLMVNLYRKNKAYCESDPNLAFKVTDSNLPFVTVQLPIYNEFYVVDRLIDAAVRLEYPADRLEIRFWMILPTKLLKKSRRIVNQYKSQGINIEHFA